MVEIELKLLRIGDIISHVHSSGVYVVTANYGDRVTAVKTVDVTNPYEWNITSKCYRDDDKETKDE